MQENKRLSAFSEKRSVEAIVRGLPDMDLLGIMVEDCLVCGICARVCPTGALESRQEGKNLNETSYIFEAMKQKISNEN
jgi:4Fe-4S ferredoxin